MSTWLDHWDRRYTDRVRLLVEILPVVASEPRFALKGGTAINLFEHDLPRLVQGGAGVTSHSGRPMRKTTFAPDVLPPGGGPTVKLRPDVFAIDALSSARTSKPLAVY